MGRRHSAPHEASVMIRLIGPRAILVNEGAEVQVMMPGAVITLIDAKATRAVFEIMVEANVLAQRSNLRAAPRGDRFYRATGQEVLAAVRISGPQPPPTILAKRPMTSPSSYGQVVVRIGRLTIACDDRAAWESQHQAWSEAYEVAKRLWGLPGRDRLAERIERKVKDRLLGDLGI